MICMIMNVRIQKWHNNRKMYWAVFKYHVNLKHGTAFQRLPLFFRRIVFIRLSVQNDTKEVKHGNSFDVTKYILYKLE